VQRVGDGKVQSFGEELLAVVARVACAVV